MKYQLNLESPKIKESFKNLDGIVLTYKDM